MAGASRIVAAICEAQSRAAMAILPCGLPGVKSVLLSGPFGLRNATVAVLLNNSDGLLGDRWVCAFRL